MIVRRISTGFDEQAMVGGREQPLYVDRREVQVDGLPVTASVNTRGSMGRVVRTVVTIPAETSAEPSEVQGVIPIKCVFEFEPPLALNPERPGGTLDRLAKYAVREGLEALELLQNAGFRVAGLDLTIAANGDHVFAGEDEPAPNPE